MWQLVLEFSTALQEMLISKQLLGHPPPPQLLKKILLLSFFEGVFGYIINFSNRTKASELQVLAQVT